MFGIKEFHTVDLFEDYGKSNKSFLIGYAIVFFIVCGLITEFFNLFREYPKVGLFEIVIAAFVTIALALYIKSKSTKNEDIENKLEQFLKSNELYVYDYDIESEENRKRILESVVLGYKLDDENLVIRYFVDGGRFSLQATEYERQLSALFNLGLTEKKVNTRFVDYIFTLKPEQRINVESNINDDVVEAKYTENVLGSIALNSKLSWEYSQFPHALIAGATGGGKTFFINYLVMEFLKDKSEVYACDPKQADLYALKRVLPDKRVGYSGGQIASIMRRVNEEMENRYKEYGPDSENYQYGYNYLDYGLNPVVVFFDEIGAFKAISDKEVSEEVYAYMRSIILRGRQMGVFMILCTQQPNADNIPTEIRDQLALNVSLGDMSSNGYRMIYGDSYDLDNVDGKGTGYYMINGIGMNKPKPFKSPYIDIKNFDVISEIEKLQNKIS